MDHECSWHVVNEWRDEPTGADWNVSREFKVQRCLHCEKEKSARALDHRRRSRHEIKEDAPSPSNLLKAVSPKQWRAVPQVLKQVGGNRLDLEHLLEQWLREGWIEVEEYRDPHSNEWRVQKVRLSKKAYQELVDQPQIKSLGHQHQEMEVVLSKLAGWNVELDRARRIWREDIRISSLLDSLELTIAGQEEALRKGQWTALPNSTQRVGGPLHQRWVIILRGIVALLASNQWEYERTFSARWLGDSKQLARDRQSIEHYLDSTLEEIGLFRHTPVVYCWGPFVAKHHGCDISGKAGSPFVALSAETVRDLEDLQVFADAILVIENQTAFEALLREPMRREDIVYLYSGGHAGYAERELVSRWLRVAPSIPWYIWTDWDFGGVRIQADWAKWAEGLGLG